MITTTIKNNDTNDLQVPFHVHTNDWEGLRDMRTMLIVANRHCKLGGNQA